MLVFSEAGAIRKSQMIAKANQAAEDGAPSPAEDGAPSPRDDDAQSVQTRTNFPETWLWTDLFSG